MLPHPLAMLRRHQERLQQLPLDIGVGARLHPHCGLQTVTWLVAANDSYFSPAFSKQLAEAFRKAGGSVDFHALPASGSEGHWLAETESGVKLAAPDLDRALKARPQAAAKKR